MIDASTASSPIIGRLVATGLHDELTSEAYAVIDGTDGRAQHVRLRVIEAFADAPLAGGIVEVRRFGGPNDPPADPPSRQPLGHRPRSPGHGAGRDLARLPAGRG